MAATETDTRYEVIAKVEDYDFRDGQPTVWSVQVVEADTDEYDFNAGAGAIFRDGTTWGFAVYTAKGGAEHKDADVSFQLKRANAGMDATARAMAAHAGYDVATIAAVVEAE